MNIYPAYILKQNPNHEKQVILLNISKGVGYYYLAVRKIAVLRGFTSKYVAEFCCLNCLHLFRKKQTNINLIKKYVKIKTFAVL